MIQSQTAETRDRSPEVLLGILMVLGLASAVLLPVLALGFIQ